MAKDSAALFAALSKLDATTIRDRDQALADLSSAIRSRGDGITDNDYHRLFEELYQSARIAKSAHVKAIRTSKSSPATRKLEVYATALRMLVDAGHAQLKSKTATSVLDHIKETLVIADDEFCEPLQTEYIKAFRTLLDQPSLVEHLKPQQWEDCLNFTVNVVSASLGDEISNTSFASAKDGGLSRSGNPLSVRISQSSIPKAAGSKSHKSLEDLIATLRSLSASPNAPVLKKAVAILDTVIECLSSTTRAQEIALATFNNVARVLLADDVCLLRDGFLSLAPMFHRLWTAKSPAVRDQLLGVLTSCQSMLLAKSDTPICIDHDIKVRLLDILQSDYQSKNVRELLQLEDVALRLISDSSNALVPKVMPRQDSSQGLAHWLTLTSIAKLHYGVASHHEQREADRDGEDIPRKRRKIASHFEELTQQAIKGSGVSQLSALQTLVLMFNETSDKAIFANLAELLKGLTALLGNEDSPATPWVFLALANLALSDVAKEGGLVLHWKTVWHTACRATAAASLARPACLALCAIICKGILGQSMTSGLLQSSLFSGGKNGPAALSDAVLILFILVLQSAALDRDEVYEAFSLNVISWLAIYWKLPSTMDRVHNAQLVAHAQPEFLCSLLAALKGTGAHLMPAHRHQSITTLRLLEAAADEQQELACTMAGTPFTVRSQQSPSIHVRAQQLGSKTRSRLESAVFDLLQSKLREFQESWATHQSGGRSNGINNDIISIAITLCITSYASSGRSSTDSAPSTATQELSSHLWDSVTDFVSAKVPESVPRLALVASIVLKIRDSPNAEDYFIAKQLLPCTESLRKLIKDRSDTSDQEEEDADMFDAMDSRNSQGSQRPSAASSSDLLRTEPLDVEVFPDSLPACLLDLTTESAKGRSESHISAQVSSDFIKEVSAMKASEVLGARQSLYAFLEANPTLSHDDILSLVDVLIGACLGQKDFDRSEAALCLCARALTRLARHWTIDHSADGDEDVLWSRCDDIYAHYIEGLLAKATLSPRLFQTIAEFLDAIAAQNPSYGGTNYPSIRTSLLKILREAPCLVKLRLAPIIGRLFDQYVLSEHGAIFTDVVEALPKDNEILEGICARLYMLSQLGMTWHTVLRQATYYLFETAAEVTSLTPLAASLIQKVSKSLSLGSSSELFALFAAQILHTWLGVGEISTTPFAAFGYSSLQDFCGENEQELVAQIALYSSQERAEELSNIVGRPWKALLSENFAASEAYCLGSQIALPPDKQLSVNPEAALRKELSTTRYIQLIENEIPMIIAMLFKTLQDDRNIEKAFEKANLQEPLKAFRQMSNATPSTAVAFFVQQPVFRSRFLIDEIQYVCSRTDRHFDSLWTPATLTYLFRFLLQDAHPALGPLYASMLLRKIRVITALGGRSVLQGYPLEMLLHNLRPYLTIFQSSEDAISIYQYLLQEGRAHLQTRLSYLAGVSISVFAALTAFVNSSQDSTTQDSHFQSTMSKAQEFRGWLADYLLNLQVGKADVTNYATLCSLVEHARSMTGSGTSSHGSHQGGVLLMLLEDQTTSYPLLQPVDFFLSVSILCRDFSAAVSPSDDILASRSDAVRMIPVLKDILRHTDVNRDFHAWAAHAIGKGVSHQGPFATVPEGRQTDSIVEDGVALSESASYHSMFRLWQELLWKENTATAGSAERCLQIVASGLDSHQLVALLGNENSQRLMNELRFDNLSCPALRGSSLNRRLESIDDWDSSVARKDWGADLVVALCSHLKDDLVLASLRDFACLEPAEARVLLPQVTHLVLSSEVDGSMKVRQKLSTIFSSILVEHAEAQRPSIRLILDTMVYLRRCKIPQEANISQRTTWLDIDYVGAARAAARCQMWHTALQLIELQQAQLHLQSSRASRRSAQSSDANLPDFLSDIYQNVDDPDFFYAGHENTDIASIVQRLNHEGAGSKLLSFQSAIFDASGRAEDQPDSLRETTKATVNALNAANLKGLSQVVGSLSAGHGAISAMTGAGFGLLNWDVASNDTNDRNSSSALATLKQLAGGADKYVMLNALEEALMTVVGRLMKQSRRRRQTETDMINLALLSETKDALSCAGKDDFEALLPSLSMIHQWGSKEDFTVVSQFLNTREYLFGTVHRNHHLRTAVGLTAPQAVLLEAKTIRSSLQLAQQHDNSQFALSRATYFSRLSQIAELLGVHIEVATQYDLARTLWGQQETDASIKILRGLSRHSALEKQDISITLSEILADLGQKVTEARFEPPNEVIDNYLMPAYKELGSDSTSIKAGQIHHTFAAFCDGQLQDQDSMEEYTRLQTIKESKEAEIAELELMERTPGIKNRDHVRNALNKARNWYKLDNQEWERVKRNRESLVLRCLEHYLLSLKACDSFTNDTLRLLTIWLDASDDPRMSEVVNKHLKSVPSWKFAGLVNQLMSRLLDTDDGFQQCLMDLMFRICSDHPHHSLYQLFAASKSKSNKNDEVAVSRHAAANKLASLVLNKSRTRETWPAMHNLSIALIRVAQGRLPEKECRSGAKFKWRSIPHGPELVKEVEERPKRIPPPTMKVTIRADRNYKDLPYMIRFEEEVSIAGGVSAPKIATVRASDGSRHKMLLKGGNDDLRQDSIMEQVFEQVSNLLQDHRATRQRKLGIRTYKVVPLLANAGIIEFVQNTMPLHEYLLPAHQRYFPKDYTSNRCRKEISNAQTKPHSQRIQAYRTVCQNFHPVMRFFFMEHFLDPDEWFYKRLNYSRSTAAISVLGHVLGLGDRHGHNILLDSSSGEVVHIDLGVAFEAGRVLPVPEMVPFRMTRDLVDGMGISGVEGVFKRCCNFTLEALRREQESIMTILDVLRYDPLYSWSVSPLRVARMQENANRAAEAGAAGAGAQETNATGTTEGTVGGLGGRRKDIDESAEASRALNVVAKKLGKGLSVEATVNELIRQATDERNLAVLFCGWAAYA